MAKVIQLLKEDTACYNRASDIIQQKIFQEVMSHDKYKVWYINNFEKIGTYWKIRPALENLVKKKILRKVKAWPVWYERIK